MGDQGIFSDKLLKVSRRLVILKCLIAAAAVVLTLLSLVLPFPTPKAETEPETEQVTSAVSSGAAATADTFEKSTAASLETTAGEAVSSEAGVPETTAPETSVSAAADYSQVAFIGDSRTLSMGTGGKLEYALVPDTSVFATWGGQLTDESAFNNAWNAGLDKAAKKAVFWYGVNDVQLNQDRDNAETFIQNYTSVVETFRASNLQTVAPSEMYFVSILNTTVNEQDHYEGQEENIIKYNEALKNYCLENGYTYLDATALLTGDSCFAEGDNIHFSKTWYETAFLPFIIEKCGL